MVKGTEFGNCTKGSVLVTLTITHCLNVGDENKIITLVQVLVTTKLTILANRFFAYRFLARRKICNLILEDIIFCIHQHFELLECF